MRNIFVVMAISAILGILSGCTENIRARNYGGEETINLAPGLKLVNMTWKENHLWVLTGVRSKDEAPQTYKFHEKSSFGVLEGTITVVEH